MTELSIIKKLDHPNIIKCLETFQDSKHFYIISEFCPGGELITPTSSAVKEHETREVIFKLLSATNHMNSQGIVHRDLKPENILIDSQGDVKIIDFGLSKFYVNNTLLTDVVGTPLYMAPEVANSSYNCECDLWSIGIIMYTMLLGTPPNLGSNTTEILKTLKTGKFELPTELKTSISPDSFHLLSRLLTKNRTKRIKLSEALQHDWFDRRIPKQVPEEVFHSIKSSSKLSRAQFLILNFALSGLNDEDTKTAKKWFRLLDSQNNAKLDLPDCGFISSIGYTEFLIFLLREKIIKTTVPKIFDYCLKAGKFSTDLLRNSLCRGGIYVSFSLFSDGFESLEDFQSFLM
jgi:calcium-dependent protein kinase